MSAELFAKIQDLPIFQIWDALNPDKNESYTLTFDKISTKIMVVSIIQQYITDGFLEALNTPMDELIKEYELYKFDIHTPIPNVILFYHVCIVSWNQNFWKILKNLKHVIIINGIEEYVTSRENPNDGICLSESKEKLLHETLARIYQCPPSTYIPYTTSGFNTHGLFKSANSTVYELQNFMQESFHSCTKMN
jgi:hypothetical protein